MGNISTEMLLMIVCSIVILSYIFSILSKHSKIPSVLLLLATGIIARYISDAEGWGLTLPEKLVEFLGVVGLIMIVLEAGLDLELGRNKLGLIRNSFFAALVIFIVSAAGITTGLYWWLREPIEKCIVYSIPLSIMSSSIVLPSIHPLSAVKKEFLVYEASFSDMLGILVFNYFTAKEVYTASAVGTFFLNIVIAIVLSVIFSIILFVILTKSSMNIKFFLIFSLLIILYEGGKMLQLPSLLIILFFGLLMRNWNMIKIPYIRLLFTEEKLKETTNILHYITAESSFLIRTFFFILFGFSIDVKVIAESDILLAGTIIVGILLFVRFLYLRFFLKESVYPEVFFIPRGLITILLFYNIPDNLKLQRFSDGILFFVILVTSVIMMIGMIFYKNREIVSAPE